MFPDRSRSVALDRTIPSPSRSTSPTAWSAGERMEDQLRVGVCLWHSFNWPGSDVFGVGHVRPALAEPWRRPDGGRGRQGRRRLRVHRASSACRSSRFHDRDVAPEGATFAETQANLDAMRRAHRAAHGRRPASRLLWGTANLFSHPRYAAGAATNPDPEVFAFAAAQVKLMLEATKRLGGAELRPVGRPRGLRDAAQHRPRARGAPARAVPARWSPSTSTGSASRACC